MAEARKLIETKKEGEFEIQKWKVIYFDIDNSKLEDIWEDESDDYEGAYYNGMGGDMDGELYFIEVDGFLRFCSNSLSSADEDEDGTYDYKKENYKYFLKVFEDYKGYTIYPNRNKSNGIKSKEEMEQ